MHTVTREEFYSWLKEFAASGVGFLGESAKHDDDGCEISKKYHDWDNVIRAEYTENGAYRVDSDWDYMSDVN